MSIRGYRSVRNLTIPIEPCSVLIGANGSGKTNLYRAFSLLHAAARGTITHEIAAEGGVSSVLWAGPRRRGQPVRLCLKAYFAESDSELVAEAERSYEIEIGLPQPTDAALPIEPLVKLERLTVRNGRRDVVMMERKGPAVSLRNEAGKRETIGNAVLPSETALVAFRDSARYPELELVRRELLDWRFYHDFRTDTASPIRQPCHAITTPTLSADGRDLAAVIATLAMIRQDTSEIDAAIDDAFPGARLMAHNEDGWCRISMQFADLQRAFEAHELSDGTLKYICLLGALMGYRLPSFIALNEPEASLHPSLLPALGRLIGRAARHVRIWIVTHSDALAEALADEIGARPRRVVKLDGETKIEGLRLSGSHRDDG